MRIIKKAFLLVLIILMLLVPQTALAFSYGDYLNTMVEFMQDMYYKDLSDADSLKAALKGIFGGLDDYSGFYDNAEAKALSTSLQGNFVGIGAALEKASEGIKIVKIYEDAPAQKAGLYEGDIITAVNGNSTLNREAEDVAAEIRGEEGTEVRLTIKRAEEVKSFVIVRGLVKINPVQYRIEGSTAYIRIDSFNSNTGDSFDAAMEIVDQQKITKIVLDLRSNTGGFVDQAAHVARRVVPAGRITTLDFKSERLTDHHYDSYLQDKTYYIAVLVDEHTASASEILAGAIQDSGNGFLVGQNTFGKGVVQNMFAVLTPEAYAHYSEQYDLKYVSEIEWMTYLGVYPEPEEILGTIKITTGHYLTRKGREIHGVGLKPEVEAVNKVNPNGVDLSLIKRLNVKNTLTLKGYDENILQAEKLLKAAGYFNEYPDKLMDVATAEALKKYQAANKLPVTGTLDLKTAEKLNNALNELRAKNDLPYMKAFEILAWF